MGGMRLWRKRMWGLKRFMGLVCLLAVLTVTGTGSALSADVEDLPRMLKISGEDHAAVVETVAGERRLVKEGDSLAGYKVAEISEGRMVLEGFGAAGPEKVIVVLAGDGQHVMRIAKIGETGGGTQAVGAVTIVPDGAAH